MQGSGQQPADSHLPVLHSSVLMSSLKDGYVGCNSQPGSCSYMPGPCTYIPDPRSCIPNPCSCIQDPCSYITDPCNCIPYPCTDPVTISQNPAAISQTPAAISQTPHYIPDLCSCNTGPCSLSALTPTVCIPDPCSLYPRPQHLKVMSTLTPKAVVNLTARGLARTVKLTSRQGCTPLSWQAQHSCSAYDAI